MAAPGDLDTSFGGDGIVEIAPVHPAERAGLDGLASSGDRVVAAGWRSLDLCATGQVARWSAGGVPDASFGDQGIVTTRCDEHGDVTFGALGLGPGGRVVAGGHNVHSDVYAGILGAFGETGDLEAGFGDGGVVRDPAFESGALNEVIPLADGRITAAGFHQNVEDTARWEVHRYLANGDPDPSFDGDGGKRYPHAPGSSSDLLRAATPDGADGTIVAVGSSGGAQSAVLIGRILSDGSLDPAFGPGGRALVTYPGEHVGGADVARTADGGFVVAGSTVRTTETVDSFRWMVLAFDANGRLNEAFGNGGRVDGPVGVTRSIAVDGRGRIVVAGTTGAQTSSVARFLPDGRPDETFGTAGVAQVPIPPSDLFTEGATAVAVDARDRVLAGGVAVSDGLRVRTVARLIGDDPPPPPPGDATSEGEIGGSGPSPAAPPAAPPAATPAQRGRVTIRVVSRRVTRRGVLVRVTWPRGTDGEARARLWTRNKGILLGQRTVAALRGTTARRFRVPLNRRAKRLLRGGRRLRVLASVRVTGLPAG